MLPGRAPRRSHPGTRCPQTRLAARHAAHAARRPGPPGNENRLPLSHPGPDRHREASLPRRDWAPAPSLDRRPDALRRAQPGRRSPQQLRRLHTERQELQRAAGCRHPRLATATSSSTPWRSTSTRSSRRPIPTRSTIWRKQGEAGVRARSVRRLPPPPSTPTTALTPVDGFEVSGRAPDPIRRHAVVGGHRSESRSDHAARHRLLQGAFAARALVPQPAGAQRLGGDRSKSGSTPAACATTTCRPGSRVSASRSGP